MGFKKKESNSKKLDNTSEQEASGLQREYVKNLKINRILDIL